MALAGPRSRPRRRDATQPATAWNRRRRGLEPEPQRRDQHPPQNLAVVSSLLGHVLLQHYLWRQGAGVLHLSCLWRRWRRRGRT